MVNQFVDKSALCSTLPRVRLCDPFYVAADAFEPSYGYRLVCVENVVGESVLFCFDRVAALAPSVSVMLEQIHRLVANDASIAPDALWYEFCTVNWLKIGPTFLPVSFDENHLMDCGPWLPLQWVAERHFVDPKCIEYMAGPVFELFTAASVSELADSRPGYEREQILRLAGLSSELADSTLSNPRVSSQGPSIWMPISGR